MSEEEQINNTDQNQTENDEFSDGDKNSLQEDFDQNGLLLKIATNGIAVQDYVKRLKESDILVAIDGEVFLDGPVKLLEKFSEQFLIVSFVRLIVRLFENLSNFSLHRHDQFDPK